MGNQERRPDTVANPDVRDVNLKFPPTLAHLTMEETIVKVYLDPHPYSTLPKSIYGNNPKRGLGNFKPEAMRMIDPHGPLARADRRLKEFKNTLTELLLAETLQSLRSEPTET